MRPFASLAIAAAALGFAFSQPAAAFDDSYPRYYAGPYGSTAYVHHHIYLPPRVMHVYQIHRPGPMHMHVVHGGGRPWGWRYPREVRLGGYFAPRYRYRYRGDYRMK